MIDDRYDFTGVSVADVLAFERLPEEQQRVAFAAFALSVERQHDRELRDARSESFDAGRASAFAEVGENNGMISKDDALTLLDRLQLFRQTLAPSDSRYLALGEIIGDFGRLLDT